jgi:hypothetical protein
MQWHARIPSAESRFGSAPSSVSERNLRSTKTFLYGAFSGGLRCRTKRWRCPMIARSVVRLFAVGNAIILNVAFILPARCLEANIIVAQNYTWTYCMPSYSANGNVCYLRRNDQLCPDGWGKGGIGWKTPQEACAASRGVTPCKDGTQGC